MHTAEQTMRVTTQCGVRQAVRPLSRRYRTDVLSLRLKRLNAIVYGDTLFSDVKSLRGNTCAQVFTTKSLVQVYPMKGKEDPHPGEALQEFIQDVGVPNIIVVDNAPEQVGPKTKFQKVVKFNQCSMRTTEPHTSKQNKVEPMIGRLRRRWRQTMTKNQVPRRLWDYGLVWEAEIISRLATSPTGRTGLEEVTGDTPDLSEWLDFDFYDWVYYWCWI